MLVEDQELPAGFTANVDAVLSVGALEETVTVSGEAPVVDVQSISQAEVLDREVLDAIPTGRNLQSTAQLIPGVKMNRPEVGLTTAAQQTYMSVHGMSNRQTTVMVDGQLVMSSGGDGAVQNYNNQLAAQEMVYETSGISAETQTGGVRISMIPREGGNTHSGQNYFGYINGALQSDNLSQRLQDRNLTSVESSDYIYDLNVAHGGPIIRDKLWFFGSGRRFSINVPVTDSFYKNEDGTAPRYMQAVKYPNGTDGLRPGVNDDRITSGLLRLTWQMSQNNKFSAYLDRIIKQRFHDYDARVDVGTASRHHGSPIYYVGAAKWTSTISSRLLLEVGYSTNVENWSNVDQEADVPDGPGLGLRGGAVGPHTQRWDPRFATCVATPCYPGVGGYPGLTDPGVMAQYSGGLDGGGIHPFLREHAAAGHTQRLRRPVPLGQPVRLRGAVQHQLLAVVRHRVAQPEVRRHEQLGTVPTDRAVERRPPTALSRRDSVPGPPRQPPRRLLPRVPGHRGVRAGHLDDRPADAQPRAALGDGQRHGRSDQSPESDAVHDAGHAARKAEHSGLDGHRAAARHGLRPVRRRLDGAEVLVGTLQLVGHPQSRRPVAHREDPERRSCLVRLRDDHDAAWQRLEPLRHDGRVERHLPRPRRPRVRRLRPHRLGGCEGGRVGAEPRYQRRRLRAGLGARSRTG